MRFRLSRCPRAHFTRDLVPVLAVLGKALTTPRRKQDMVYGVQELLPRVYTRIELVQEG